MPWTSRDEKEILKEWADKYATIELNQKYLPIIDKTSESYWETYEETNNVREYSFDSIPELREILKEQLTEEYFDDIITVLSVATLKNKPIDTGDSGNKDKKISNIPEYVYVF